MTGSATHGAWLSFLDVSGPFLAEPILKEAFPQGLEGLDPPVKKETRLAYEEWREAVDFGDVDLVKLHDAWIAFVLARVLGFSSQQMASGQPAADKFRHTAPESGMVIVADGALTDGNPNGRSFVLLTKYAPHTPLDEAAGKNATTPIERMIELCRATGVRLGLVTNGERWTLVDAPVGAVVSVASWYARLWSQEPTTLQAFADLLGVRRFFGAPDGELTKLLDRSLTFQDEVTDALGEQVRRAVEVLVQALDRADQDRNRELLKDVSPAELYEAGLTLMMRIVFLLSAEERGLLLLGDPRYEADYAVSTLRAQLRLQPEEILERRWDAWSRLLALFRAVYAGVNHDILRMPALGGSLFDPDRFPFLEGRAKGSAWKSDPAVPLPIDNRTVLLLLEAVQLYQGRTLSYLALDVEQIGYVYEGLLERTVIRAKDPTLDLIATKSALHPWVTLAELDNAAADGAAAIETLLKERTGSSASRIRNDLAKEVNDDEAGKLLAACHADVVLRDRLKPYFHLLRTDSWGYPLVYPNGTFMVTSGSDRRETGTHYTPKSLTEVIVREALEPLVYVGPSGGAPRNEWKLRSAEEILQLKICDPAMGSGAFLVQVCRYLGEQIVEAWAEAERVGRFVTADGEVRIALGPIEPLTAIIEERVLVARRLVAERCLYGVDMNPLAVELAKLSIWLVTLAKGRPFGFLDHNLRCGDSLLGIKALDQIEFLDMEPGPNSSRQIFAGSIEQSIAQAVRIRSEIRQHPIRDTRDVDAMYHLDWEARQTLRGVDLVADALTGATLRARGRSPEMVEVSVAIGDALSGGESAIAALRRLALTDLSTDQVAGKPERRPFHWPLEFPEVFSDKRGFDAIVGNPPFLGGVRISELYGDAYNDYLSARYGSGKKVDICAFFFRRAHELLAQDGMFGLLATNTISQGTTRKSGLLPLLRQGVSIVSAVSSFKWPGKASVVASFVVGYIGSWRGAKRLNGRTVAFIGDLLAEQSETQGHPSKLLLNASRSYQGSSILGMGFFLTPAQARDMISADPRNSEVVRPVFGGKELNGRIDNEVVRWIIDFFERERDEAESFREPFEVVESLVKPERLLKDEKKYPRLVKTWWKFWHSRQRLYEGIDKRKLTRVLVRARVSDHHMVDFLPADVVFTEQLVVFLLDGWADFAVLQSSVHDVWARKYASTMKNDVRYIPPDCFETFPYPQQSDALQAAGRMYWEQRQRIKTAESIGLTELYNRFHDANEMSKEFVRLRELHVLLDNVVWCSFGFSPPQFDHKFYKTSRGQRFCASEIAREKMISELLQLNHRIAEHQSADDSDLVEADELEEGLFNFATPSWSAPPRPKKMS